MQQMIIDISPDGDTKISVRGVKGKGCRALTADIERELGDVKSDEPTKEMKEVDTSAIVYQTQR
jgi:hypothetical protein